MAKRMMRSADARALIERARGPSSPEESRPLSVLAAGGRVDADAIHGKRLPVMLLAALGIVFGDIGTSPLYTMREAFGPAGGLPLRDTAVLGVLSLVFWSLILIVTVKYVLIIMRAGNQGEGGVLALGALAQRACGKNARMRRLTVLLALVGTALFFGDGVLTPAISVLSAVEGLKVVTPALEPLVVPTAVGILVGLFVLQRLDTAGVGALFGPIMLVWFAVLGVLGFVQIIAEPEVLRALNPVYGWTFFTTYGWQSFVALGAIVLAVTGAEALYADMGHFGSPPIRIAWFGVVLPGLAPNYFGQGALLIQDPEALTNPFYLLAPGWALMPMVGLATVATIIASQAVISGVFSLARQAVQLDYLPRLEIRHTSARVIGQIYLPRLNWILMVAVVAVLVGFGSSSNLAAAYGISVVGAMTLDVVLALVVALLLWRWHPPIAISLFTAFLLVDLAFLGANLLKVPAGGWFPILLAGGLVLLMSTWRRGREALIRRLYRTAPPLPTFLSNLSRRPLERVPGTAVFLTGNLEAAPRALLHNLKHNKVLHERVVLLKVVIEDVPRVLFEDRRQIEHVGANFHQVLLRYGFMEEPDVTDDLAACQFGAPEIRVDEVSFFLSRETFVPSPRPDLPRWREQIFIQMAGEALDATRFFGLPPDRVVEIGTQVEI